MTRQETAQGPSKVEELKKQLEAALLEEAQQVAHKAAQQELSKTQTSFTEAIAKAAVEAGELRRKVKDLQEELEKVRGEARAAEHPETMAKLAAMQSATLANQKLEEAKREIKVLQQRLAASEGKNKELLNQVQELKAKEAKEASKAKMEPVNTIPVKSNPSWADVLEQEVQREAEAAAEAAKAAEAAEAAKAEAKAEAKKAKAAPVVNVEAKKAQAAPAAPAAEDLEAQKLREARVAARQRQIEEQRKKEDQKIAELKRLRKQREEEERREKEEEEAAREQQRREDEEREARKMLDQAIQKQEEEEKARRKLVRQEERKKREEEEQKRLEQQKVELSAQDFEALLLMKAEVEPEEECSPDELDEDEILDLEIKRVQREEMKKELQKKMAARSSPGMVEMMLGAFPEDLQNKISKSRQEKQRSVLKQKLQAKREMASLAQGRRH